MSRIVGTRCKKVEQIVYLWLKVFLFSLPISYERKQKGCSMNVRTMVVVLKEGIGRVSFDFTTWVIKDGYLLVRNLEKNEEVSVFPLTSIVCFYDRMKV